MTSRLRSPRPRPRRLVPLCLLGCLSLAGAQDAAAEPLAKRVSALTKGFKGTTVIYAKHLTTGREFALGADTKVRTASTIKLPILCALESLVAAGKVRWDERIVLKPEDKVSGSGVLGNLADGTDLTVRNLAILMIIVSDNTATNLVLDRISADAVNEYLDTIGLTQSRSNRKVRGDGTKLAAPTGWSKAGLLDENKKYGLGVSTPREMVRLLELIHQGKVVSADASRDVIDILKQQQIKAAIGRHAPDDLTIASKSGSLDALRSDVGIVYTKSGPIAIAITVDDMPQTDYSPDNVGEKLIWELTQLLIDGLSASGPASAEARALPGAALPALAPAARAETARASAAPAAVAPAAATSASVTHASPALASTVSASTAPASGPSDQAELIDLRSSDHDALSDQAPPDRAPSGQPPAPATAPPPGRFLLGKFEAISNTATSVTGNLVVSEYALTFSLDQKYETRFLKYVPASEAYAKGGGSWAELQNVPPATPVEVRAVSSEIVGRKAPNKGLCAAAKTTFVALVSAPDASGGPSLALAAFKGATPPGAGADAHDLCGTFRYAPTTR